MTMSKQQIQGLTVSFALLVGALAQCLVPLMPFLWQIGQPINQQVAGQGFVSPEIPAGYAFSIWGVLFVAALLVAIRSLRTSIHSSGLFGAMGGWLTVSVWLSSLWMLVAQNAWQQPWVLVGLIVALAWSAYQGLKALLRFKVSLDPFDRWVTHPLLGLLSGWVTMAQFLNLSDAVKQTILPLTIPEWLGMSESTWGLLVLGVAFTLAWQAWKSVAYDTWFGIAVSWALVGVMVANWQHDPPHMAFIWFTGGALLLMVMAYGRSHPWSVGPSPG